MLTRLVSEFDAAVRFTSVPLIREVSEMEAVARLTSVVLTRLVSEFDALARFTSVLLIREVRDVDAVARFTSLLLIREVSEVDAVARLVLAVFSAVLVASASAKSCEPLTASVEAAVTRPVATLSRRRSLPALPNEMPDTGAFPAKVKLPRRLVWPGTNVAAPRWPLSVAPNTDP